MTEPEFDTESARELRPVLMDHNPFARGYKDFRPVVTDANETFPAPKASSAPASVDSLNSSMQTDLGYEADEAESARVEREMRQALEDNYMQDSSIETPPTTGKPTPSAPRRTSTPTSSSPAATNPPPL